MNIPLISLQRHGWRLALLLAASCLAACASEGSTVVMPVSAGPSGTIMVPSPALPQGTVLTPVAQPPSYSTIYGPAR